MARALILAMALAALSGCATTVPRVQYVAVPCVAADDVLQEPLWLMDVLPEDASGAEIVRAAMADLITAVQVGAHLRAVLQACAHPAR